MKALAFGVVLGGVVIVASACGAASPVDDCNSAASAICSKLFECAATFAAQTYQTQSNCETQLRASYQCASLSCSSGTTYHNDKVQACINDVKALSCANAQQTPPSCQGFSTSTVCY